MREIKFRAWHKETKEIFDVHGLTLTAVEKRENGISYVYGRHDVILMQYTGWKNRVGQEIFEGDILKWEYTGTEIDFVDLGSELFEVVFRESCFMAKGLNYPYFQTLQELSDDDMIKIVGNVFENPGTK